MQAFNDLETAAFCDQMALILKSGISSTEGLSVMLEDTSDPSEREVLLAILNKNEETGSFAKALASTCVFPDYMLNMVSIGEETGRLDEVMSQLASHYEREDSIRRNVRSTFAYPIIMIAMMIIVIVILLAKVMPIFAAVFRQLGTEMTGFSKGLLNIGTAISSSSVVLISVLALIAILGILAIKTEVGRSAARRLGSKIRSIREIMDSTAACRFAGAMALTLSSGLSPDRCIELAEELNSDAVFSKKIAECRKLVSEGKDLSAAIHQTDIFSGVYSRLVSIGQKTGNMDDSMRRIAALYQEEIDSRMNNMLAVLEPAMVIVISIVVGIILLSVMLPLIGIMAAI